jgi:hypothetical protein
MHILCSNYQVSCYLMNRLFFLLSTVLVALSFGLFFLTEDVFIIYALGIVQVATLIVYIILNYQKTRKFYMIYFVIFFHIFFLNIHMLFAFTGVSYVNYITKFGSFEFIDDFSLKVTALISIISLWGVSTPSLLGYKFKILNIKKVNFSAPSQKFIFFISLLFLSIIFIESWYKFLNLFSYAEVESKYTNSSFSNPIIALIRYTVLPLFFLISFFDLRKAAILVLLYMIALKFPLILTLDRSSFIVIVVYFLWFYSIFLDKKFNLILFLSISVATLFVLIFITFLRFNIDFDAFLNILLLLLSSQSDTFLTLAYAVNISDTGSSSIFSQSSIFYDYYNFYLNRSGVAVSQTSEYLSLTNSISHLLTYEYSSVAYFDGKGLGTSYLLELLSLYGADYIPLFCLYIFFFSLSIGFLATTDQCHKPSFIISFIIFSTVIFITRSSIALPYTLFVSILFFLIIFFFMFFLSLKSYAK